jgi:hypothetical protein
MDRYVDVDLVQEPASDLGDRLAAKITKREGKHTEQFSFRIVRCFDLDGETRETAWMDHRHFDRIGALVERVKDRMQLERKQRTVA